MCNGRVEAGLHAVRCCVTSAQTVAGGRAALRDVTKYTAAGATWCVAGHTHMALLAPADAHAVHSSVLDHDAVLLHMDKIWQVPHHSYAYYRT